MSKFGHVAVWTGIYEIYNETTVKRGLIDSKFIQSLEGFFQME